MSNLVGKASMCKTSITQWNVSKRLRIQILYEHRGKSVFFSMLIFGGNLKVGIFEQDIQGSFMLGEGIVG
jgi:hypothetical protein